MTRRKIQYFFTIFCLALFIICCENEKSNDVDMGHVSFGSNTSLLNCVVDVYVFIDNSEKGKIPSQSFADSVVDCTTPSNLNLSIPVGVHDFKVEIREVFGGCWYRDTSGTITVIKDKCIPIFIDVTKLN
jgi:hypothetical protein